MRSRQRYHLLPLLRRTSPAGVGWRTAEDRHRHAIILCSLWRVLSEGSRFLEPHGTLRETPKAHTGPNSIPPVWCWWLDPEPG